MEIFHRICIIFDATLGVVIEQSVRGHLINRQSFLRLANYLVNVVVGRFT